MPLRVECDKWQTLAVWCDLVNRLIQRSRRIEFASERTSGWTKTRIYTDPTDFLLSQSGQGAEDADGIVVRGSIRWVT